MNEELYLEKHKNLEEKLKVHYTRLNDHAGRIDKLEQNDKANAVRIDNLCNQIASLVTTMRWFIGLIVGSFVGFFFYAAQRGLIK